MMHAFITDYLVLVLLFSVHIICSDGSGLEIDSWQVVYRRFFLRNYVAAMRMYSDSFSYPATKFPRKYGRFA